MSKGANSPGISRLASVIQKLADKNVDKSLTLDFGEIQGDGSLMTNTFPISIPKTDYILCAHLDGIPSAGTRVLVGWVDNDAVVIDAIIDAQEGEENG